MLHKNALPSAPAVNASPDQLPLQKLSGLSLVRKSSEPAASAAQPSALRDLTLIAARRASSFCAEAAVLVLVFGLLDYFMTHGQLAAAWIAGALALSVALLAASIALDFGAHRWLQGWAQDLANGVAQGRAGAHP
jgi:hypothetical protein